MTIAVAVRNMHVGIAAIIMVIHWIVNNYIVPIHIGSLNPNNLYPDLPLLYLFWFGVMIFLWWFYTWLKNRQMLYPYLP